MSGIRTLGADEPIPPGVPRRYLDGRGYVRLRWHVGVETYVEEYEHRIVMGRPEGFEVHHVNGVKDDNSAGNLQVLTKQEHASLHGGVWKNRPLCERKYGRYRSRHAMEKAQRTEQRRQDRAERARKVCAMYAEDKLTTIEIGEIVGLDPSGVSRILTAAGVVGRKREGRELDADEIAEKYKAGRSQQSLAIEYQVTGDRIRDVLLSAGCPIRKPGRPKKPSQENRARNLVTRRSGRVCEKCGHRPATEWHHRRNRSQGGEWSAANGLHLCRECHRYVTEHPAESYKFGWAVRSGKLHPEQVPAYLWRDAFGPSWCWLHDDGSVSSVSPDDVLDWLGDAA